MNFVHDLIAQQASLYVLAGYEATTDTTTSNSSSAALDVQSRHLVEWSEVEPLRLFCPCLADVFVGSEALRGLGSAGEVIGGGEVGEVTSKLVMGVGVVALDGGLLEGVVHVFDLPVG